MSQLSRFLQEVVWHKWKDHTVCMDEACITTLYPSTLAVRPSRKSFPFPFKISAKRDLQMIPIHGEETKRYWFGQVVIVWVNCWRLPWIQTIFFRISFQILFWPRGYLATQVFPNIISSEICESWLSWIPCRGRCYPACIALQPEQIMNRIILKARFVSSNIIN